VSVLRALATNDVTIVSERLSANDVLAMTLALEVTSLVNIVYDEVYSPLRQYNTVQYNAKREIDELKHAYKSTKLVCDSSVIKISKKNFSLISHAVGLHCPVITS